ncbi:hypothetical protein DSO57_1017033 [Entomophthora muscae]|uniref:Uncharacterized protein n=1 Tax=Entomophthora muscae TaxID=34485 RepID=A0ACC2TSR5_9FUNG|nr:hypothetical protein DSO57_1017033 [Entomophthora muscae]
MELERHIFESSHKLETIATRGTTVGPIASDYGRTRQLTQEVVSLVSTPASVPAVLSSICLPASCLV